MIKSMTGYGRSRMTVNGRDITVEMKSVNNRYFECNVKLPRSYTYLEEKVKAYIQACGISRGKIDVFITVDMPEGEGVIISLDEAYTSSYLQALKKLVDDYGLKDDISVMRVAANRDIFTVTKPEDDIEGEWGNVKTVLTDAIRVFDKARTDEGERLEKDITTKKENISCNILKIAVLGENAAKEYEERLRARLRDVIEQNDITYSENRILTECAVFADRVAIDEEIVRLQSHVCAFDEYMKSGEPVGRKLDFQLQEMNREANTIGSKAQNTEITRLVVEIKCDLEKIREQIQNIE